MGIRLIIRQSSLLTHLLSGPFSASPGHSVPAMQIIVIEIMEVYKAGEGAEKTGLGKEFV